MKIKAVLTDTNGVKEARTVSLGWIIRYITSMAKGGIKFALETEGGRIEIG